MNAILMLMLAADPGSGLAGQDIVLLDFTAGYCAPCQQMMPLLQSMEQDGYPIQKIDITDQPELSRRFGVDRIPTLVLLVEGKEVKRFIGLTGEDELRREMRIARDNLLESRGQTSRGPGLTSERPAAERSSVLDEVVRAGAPAAGRAGSNLGGTLEGSQAAVPERRSLGDLFKGMFGSDKPSAFEFPTVRAQDAQLDATIPDSLANALNATVRIKVTGKSLQDVGTGTIIYSVPGQSLVLTCAHLFAGQDKDAKVEVDVFQNGQARRFPAQIKGGNHDSDLAVIQIQSAEVLPFVSINAVANDVLPQQPATSFGCDNGRVPSALSTRVLRINQYKGPSNLTCLRDPVQGRSGGGLFDQQGRLLAVCSCADRDNKEGLYMSQPAILALMQKLDLQYAVNASPGSTGEDPAEAFAAAQEQSRRQLTPSGNSGMPDQSLAPIFAEVTAANTAAMDPQVSPYDQMNATSESAATAQQSLSDPFRTVPALDGTNTDSPSAGSDLANATVASLGETAGQLTAAQNRGGTRVTVLIDSDTPGAVQRMIVIPDATPWLVELLTGEPTDSQAAVRTASAN